MAMAVAQTIEAEMSREFDPGWGRVPGIGVEGRTLRIDPEGYFFRRSDRPVWVLVDWDRVVEELLPLAETESRAVEQQALEFVRAFGQRTEDAAAVLRTADRVYTFLFSPSVVDDPDLGVTARELRILRESATVAALNRVEVSGEIADIGPAWFVASTAQVVFGLDDAETERIDELYHGGFFNEYRRVASIRAHAALGGRLVHGCQSSPNLSGGAVAPYGVDLDRFREELGLMRENWLDVIHDLRDDTEAV